MELFQNTTENPLENPARNPLESPGAVTGGEGRSGSGLDGGMVPGAGVRGGFTSCCRVLEGKRKIITVPTFNTEMIQDT